MSTTLFPGPLTWMPRKGMSYGRLSRRIRQINSVRKAVQLQQGDMLSEVAHELEDADRKVNATRPGIHMAEA